MKLHLTLNPLSRKEREQDAWPARQFSAVCPLPSGFVGGSGRGWAAGGVVVAVVSVADLPGSGGNRLSEIIERGLQELVEFADDVGEAGQGSC